MMTKHTPGPWAEYRDSRGVLKIVGADSSVIAEPREWLDLHAGEAEANARLIAAAPEMLEALETLLRLDDDPEDFEGETLEALAIAREAVAKARGEQ